MRKSPMTPAQAAHLWCAPLADMLRQSESETALQCRTPFRAKDSSKMIVFNANEASMSMKTKGRRWKYGARRTGFCVGNDMHFAEKTAFVWLLRAVVSFAQYAHLSLHVIPAKAGMHSASLQKCVDHELDSRFRGNDVLVAVFERGQDSWKKDSRLIRTKPACL